VIQESTYSEPKLNADMVANYQDIIQFLADFGKRQNCTVVDARPERRFAGVDPEPRPHLSSGHVPSSINLFFKQFVTPSGELISNTEIEHIFKAANVPLDEQIVAMLYNLR
jgi:thiosulfate/3-mercaptopyruvate sulfurtransferase